MGNSQDGEQTITDQTLTDTQNASSEQDNSTNDNLKKKRKKKDTKIYILCGVVSTLIICELFLTLVGAIFAYLLNVPISDLCSFLLTSELGSGGIKLLKDYTLFVGLMISFIILLAVVKPWKPYLNAFWRKSPGNRVPMIFIGLAIGFAMNAICILAAVLMGNIHVEFQQFSIIGFLVFLVFIFIQSSTEELVCRGFAYQRIKRTYNVNVAIIASAAIFSFGHIFNPGVTPLALFDIFLTGVLYAQMVRHFNSIWLPMGVHTAWNFTQNILFGLPNSGMASSYSFFGLVGNSTSGLAYDTGFGVEGTVFAVAMNIVCIVILYLWGRKRKNKEYNIWEGSALEASEKAFESAAASASADAPVTTVGNAATPAGSPVMPVEQQSAATANANATPIAPQNAPVTATSETPAPANAPVMPVEPPELKAPTGNPVITNTPTGTPNVAVQVQTQPKKLWFY